MTSTSITTLVENGVSIWLDDLSRERLQTGSLKQLIDETGVTGVTTNPTIFKNALSQPELYNSRIAELTQQGFSTEDIVFSLMSEDVAEACDVLSGVFASSNKRDGFVSIEVSPDLARDTDATYVQATKLWQRVNRKNAMVKIPATNEGLPAITKTLASGISVNVTLIFHQDRYAQVLNAYLSGMKQALENGYALEDIHSVASFFVSRWDTAIENLLAEREITDTQPLIGTVALANARKAYESYQEFLRSEELHSLQSHGAQPQRLLYASTGMKNPQLSPSLYVDELVAPHIVNTMPEATLIEVANSPTQHSNTIVGKKAHDEQVFDLLQRHQIDLTKLAQELEGVGVESFMQSWNALLEMVQKIQRG